MSGERVAKGVTSGPFGPAEVVHGGRDGAHDGGLMNVMSPDGAGPWASRQFGRREHELPGQFMIGIGELSFQGGGHFDSPESAGDIRRMKGAAPFHAMKDRLASAG